MDARRRPPRRQDGGGASHPRAGRTATILDVAARAGVSKSLVSRVFRDSPQVSPARRAAVLRAATELGYRPNAAARTLVRRRSHAVGILVADLHNLFLPEVAVGLDAVLEGHGYTTFVVTGKHRRHTEEAALGRLLELRVDGIVCATAHLGPAALREAATSTAIVNLTRTPQVPRIDSVVGDDQRGASLVVEHLIGLGHERIAMVGDTEERAGADRIRGYRNAMASAGHGARASVVPGGFTEAGGHRAALALLETPPAIRPTAIFVASDLAALGVLDGAAELGIDVPAELSVVGYDNTPLAALRHINLSSVDQSAVEIGTSAAGALLGTSAAGALLERMSHRERPARRRVIAPSLVVRGTCGPPRP